MTIEELKNKKIYLDKNSREIHLILTQLNFIYKKTERKQGEFSPHQPFIYINNDGTYEYGNSLLDFNNEEDGFEEIIFEDLTSIIEPKYTSYTMFPKGDVRKILKDWIIFFKEYYNDDWIREGNPFIEQITAVNNALFHTIKLNKKIFSVYDIVKDIFAEIEEKRKECLEEAFTIEGVNYYKKLKELHFFEFIFFISELRTYYPYGELKSTEYLKRKLDSYTKRLTL